MTDRSPDDETPARPRRPNPVAVLAVVLLGLLLSVIAWLALWPESPGGGAVRVSLPPAASIALSPPTAPVERPAPPASSPDQASPSPSETAQPDSTTEQRAAAPSPPLPDVTLAPPPAAETQSPPMPMPLPAPPMAAPAPAPPQIAQAPETPADHHLAPEASRDGSRERRDPPDGRAEASSAAPPPPEAPQAALPEPAPAAPQAGPPPAETPSAGQREETSTAATEPPAIDEPSAAPGESTAEAAPEMPPETPTTAPVAPPSSIAPQVAIIPAPPAYQPQQRQEPTPAPDRLSPAPDPGLLEQTQTGPLPIIGKDGRKSWQVYSRPFDRHDKRPRIALVISGMGQSAAATETAIQRLPGAVTLAFSPLSKTLEQGIAMARAAGHETLITVPMEPISSEMDPGPYALLTSLSERDNRDRLQYLLSRASGYVGVLNSMGGRLTTTAQSLRPILTEINNRGLLFVDAVSSPRSMVAAQAREIGLPRAINNGFIDIKASRSDIDARLEELVQLAQEHGHAVGIGSPYPVTIERVALWAQELEGKGVVLAPISAVVEQVD